MSNEKKTWGSAADGGLMSEAKLAKERVKYMIGTREWWNLSDVLRAYHNETREWWTLSAVLRGHHSANIKLEKKP